jgi:hypothetical protein
LPACQPQHQHADVEREPTRLVSSRAYAHTLNILKPQDWLKRVYFVCRHGYWYNHSPHTAQCHAAGCNRKSWPRMAQSPARRSSALRPAQRHMGTAHACSVKHCWQLGSLLISWYCWHWQSAFALAITTSDRTNSRN